MNRVPAKRVWCFASLAIGLLAWDLGSKSWVFNRLGYPFHQSDWKYATDFLWGRLEIQLMTSFNRGALWGIGQGYSWLFALLSLGAAGFILYWLFVRGEARSWWLTVTLALIMAGTLGNLYDRLHLHGCQDGNGPVFGVRDFLYFKIPFIAYEWPLQFHLIQEYDWPIFNFADVFLVTGAILLTLHSLQAPVDNKPSSAGELSSETSATDASPSSANAANTAESVTSNLPPMPPANPASGDTPG